MKNYIVKHKQSYKFIEGKHYTFDKETKIFTVDINNIYYHDLIIDFSNYDNITFNIGSFNTLKCGDNCTIECGSSNDFYLGKNCLIKEYNQNNKIYSCKENCKIESIDYLNKKLINQFYIPTNFIIRTNNSKLGFKIVK